MTLRTITFDDSIYKLVPREPTIEITHAALDLNRSQMPSLRAPIGFEYFLFGEAYRAMIAAAPEYQEPDVQILFAWFIPACGMFTRSKDERDKWVAKGHKVLPLHVIPKPYKEPEKKQFLCSKCGREDYTLPCRLNWPKDCPCMPTALAQDIGKDE